MRTSLVLVCMLQSDPATPPAGVVESIDAAIRKKASDAATPIAPPTSDAEFLRRAWLDLAGTLPSAAETRAFLASDRPDKRAQLIEQLPASEDFVRWWGRFLLELSIGERAVPGDSHNGRALYESLCDALRSRKPYPQIVQDLLCAEGLMGSEGNVNFILRYGASPPEVAGAVSRNFLGLRLQCAQCHDHPHDQFTRDDFWGIAAFFAKTKLYYVNDTGEMGLVNVRHSQVEMPPVGDPVKGLEGAASPTEQEQPIEERQMQAAPPEAPLPVTPRFLNGEVPRPGVALRQEIARLVTSPESSPTFVRNLVNRVWARLLGTGLIEPIDDLSTHQPSHPEVMAELESNFVKSGYDLHELVSLIASTQAYQRSSANHDRLPAAQSFVRAQLRPLTIDQLYESVRKGTGYLLDEDGSEAEPDPSMTAEQLAEQTEGEADYADAYPAEFSGGEGTTLLRSLTMLQSEQIQGAAESLARLTMKLFGQPVCASHVEYAYLALLSRPPTAKEAAMAAEYFSIHGAKRTSLEDIVWAILNSVEFLNNR